MVYPVRPHGMSHLERSLTGHHVRFPGSGISSLTSVSDQDPASSSMLPETERSFSSTPTGSSNYDEVLHVFSPISAFL